MSDDVDDEFRQIVASQLADLDVESLDELDVWDTPPGSPSEPAVPGRDQPPAASTDQPPAPPRDQPLAPPRDRPVAPSPGRPSVPPQPPVRSMP
ncbi:MAG TPA: hypothetical protein VFK68_01660, partial [Propionibacteriaceae bacterium]|nr:hypothetical protein [Propionibacteriaceae bacterium]